MSGVVVVGAGLIGLTAAWRTAQAGATVTLVDTEPERAASRVAAGMLAPVSELNYGESALFRLGTVASRGYPDFIAELTNISGIDVDYRQRGTVSVALDNDDHRALAEIFEYAAVQGAKVHKLRGSDCRRQEPGLNPGVRGGWLVETDHQVDPRRLLRSLEVAAQRAGVRRLTAGAARLHSRHDRVTGIETESGDLLNTDAVVIAAGCWSARIEGVPISARPPVRPIKGQLLRLRA
ncbi:MAG: FAD-dependent oxidoreductase, partial [Mycobacteriales bacterium]